ncbi:MAG TPA: NUDIX domain-containing protein [Thermoguttaceae bacterium]|nr:NUDIX domain-containing protein [Thermoguttaceae bacterium]
MPESTLRIDVVVTTIYCGDKVLVVHNGDWGGFTLPMTKQRRWPPGFDGTDDRWETGSDAAMRNAGRCLGATFARPPGLLGDVRGIRQRSPTGVINEYLFQVFGFRVDEPRIGEGVVGQWLTAEEILEPKRRPVSPTARTLVDKLKEFGRTRGGFPPAPPTSPPRLSIASEAIIRRQRRGESKQWLCQWNGHWGRYFLIGGHREDKEGGGSETAEACLHREIHEELGLTQGADYDADFRAELKYGAWSTSSWQPTDYKIAAFDVALKDPACARIEAKSENRWLTREEILSERCADGKLISLTTREMLKMLGDLR